MAANKKGAIMIQFSIPQRSLKVAKCAPQLSPPYLYTCAYTYQSLPTIQKREGFI